MEYIIGIDTGTSNTKAVAFSFKGKILASSKVAYASLPVDEGFHEQDPQVLLEAFIHCIRDVAIQLPDHILAGISCSSAMHSLMAVDAHNKPLSNLITWADNRSSVYASELHDSGKSHLLTIVTGTPVHPMSPLCKLIWLRKHAPSVFHEAKKFIGIKEFIFYYLFGEYVIDYSIASATGLFDIQRKSWHTDALELAGIEKDKLSSAVETSTSLRKLNTTAAQRLGISVQTPFVIGASDGCLATLGSNAVKQGDCSLTIGTSGAVRMINSKSQLKTDLLFNYILDDEHYVSGGPINNGGIVLKWYAENFLNKKVDSETDLGWFAEIATGAPAGAEGLLFLPYLFGERAPVWNADARAVFFGVHAGHKPVHFMRSIIEGISFALYQILLLLEQNISPVKKIYCSGGFTGSEMWLQIIADIFNKPVIVSTVRDASATGAAILGMKALDIGIEFTGASSEQRTFFPNHSCSRTYQQLFPVYVSLYDSLKSQFNALAALR